MLYSGIAVQNPSMARRRNQIAGEASRNHVMSVTEDMWWKAWEGESFRERSSQELKGPSLDDEKFQSMREVKTVRKSPRNEQMIAITSPVLECAKNPLHIKHYAPWSSTSCLSG
ncbi:hypothetical protein NNRS527_00477 [Nitrosospira sp. NRS527]|nr:hypothetical protein NNRS527_00477 [Nitrosospira sp. NRS527]